MSKQTIMTLSWHMLNNDAQYWSVRTNANDLFEENNLPRSTLQLIMPGLKINKELRTPVGITKEWRAAPVFKKREREQEHHRGFGEIGGMIPHDETHPKVKKMMREYYNMFDYIMGSAICTKAGIHISELGLENVCLNYILGKCTMEGCTQQRTHPRADEATEEQVNQLCNKLSRGVNELTRAKRMQGEQ